MVFRNEDIKRLVMGTPPGHTHIRTIIETDDGNSFTFQEATIANLVRAYITLKTHPQRKVIEQVQQKVSGRKTGYAGHQLMETETDESSILEELSQKIP
jgi:hypothetical protein